MELRDVNHADVMDTLLAWGNSVEESTTSDSDGVESEVWNEQNGRYVRFRTFTMEPKTTIFWTRNFTRIGKVHFSTVMEAVDYLKGL